MASEEVVFDIVSRYNDDGLSRYQRELRDAKDTSEKLGRSAEEAFKEAGKQAGVAAGATGKQARETRKLTGIIEKLEDEYQQLGRKIKEAQNVDDIKRFRQEQAKVARELDKVNKSTAPIAKNAKDAERSFLGMGTSIGDVVGKLGLAAAGTAALGAFVGEVRQAVTEINKATQTAATLFQTNEARAEGLATQARVIGKVFDEDINEVLQAANVLSEEFGISGEAALDVINTGFEKGANVRGEFLEQLKEYGTFFDALGLSADQAIAVIAQQEESGTFSDKGVDTLKEFALSLRELTKPAQEALDAIGLSGEELQSQIRAGNLTVFEAAQLVSERLNELPEQSKEVGQVFADVFKGAGEDARSFVFELQDVDINLENIESRVTEAEAASRNLTEEWAEFTNQVAQGEGAIGDLFTVFKQLTADLIVGLRTIGKTAAEIRGDAREEAAQDAAILRERGEGDAQQDFKAYLKRRRQLLQESLDEEVITEEQFNERVNQSRTSLAESFINNQFSGILQQRREELEDARAALASDDSEENELAAQQAKFNLEQLQAEIDSVTKLAVELDKGATAGKSLNDELDGDGDSDTAPPKIQAATGSLNDLQAKLKEVTDQLANADPNNTRLFTGLNQKAADLRKEIEIIQQRSQALTDDFRPQAIGREELNDPLRLTVPVQYKVDEDAAKETEDEIRSNFDALKTEVAALGGELDSVLGTNGLDVLFDNLLVFFTDELPRGVNKGQAAFQAAAAGIAVITSALNNFYSQQIQQNEQYIDSLNQRVSEQQQAIQQEQEAADAGRANNLESERQTLENLQQSRREALAEQEKLQRRQAAVQALQQAGALATTAAQLFASQAPKGIIGVGIAAGLLSTVLGLFSAFKQKSRAEVFAREGHAEILGGELHANGGTNLGFVEAERGEAFGILNRRASQKYGKDFVQLVDDLNNGRNPVPALPDIAVKREPLREAMQISMEGGRRGREQTELAERLASIESLLSQWPHQVAVRPGDTIMREQGNKKQTIKIS